MEQPHELFVVVHLESGQPISVYGFAPFVARGEIVGGEFLVYTSDGWDFRPVGQFAPFEPKKLELEDDEGS